MTIATAACALAPLSPTWADSVVRVRHSADVAGAGPSGRVISVPLEQYVASAVASEVYADWPAAALRAQAVIARTYALHERAQHARDPFDVESTVISQRYGATPVSAPVRRGVQATRGEYLSHHGQPILAVFHAVGGGRTAASEEVWSEALPYLRSVESPDDDAPDFFWSYEIAPADFFDAVRASGLDTDDGPVAVVRRTPSGRVALLQAGDVELSGRDARDLLGGRALRSTLFDVQLENGSLRFFGSGSGHGVGLSQWGAREFARRGWSYRQILAHYYPGTALRSLDGGSSPRRESR
ncbi:MAG: SpoIID/LytB domain-containing protein [Deltaproteobacteria bacterium]|nr:SpoIID/LytB domain-containing protein [Deltaproteobacteria bacterium]